MTRRPRLGIVGGKTLAPNMRGVLANLAALLGEGWELHLSYGESALPAELAPFYAGHGVAVGGPDPLAWRYGWHATRKLITGVQPDVLMNVAQPHGLGASMVLAARRSATPTVVRMTGDTFGEHRQAPTLVARGRKWLAHSGGGYVAYRYANRILPVGRYLAESLRARGLDGGRITVLPQPFDPVPFAPAAPAERRALRARLGLPQDAPVALYVGRLSWLKGTDRLYEIARQVGERAPEMRFCAIGQGDWAAKLAELGNVRHVPGADRETTANYYRCADLLVFPSRAEGLPNVVLEALAARLPVAATPVGEVPHYVTPVGTDPEAFVRYILAGGWQPAPVPAWFDRQVQAEAYESVLRQTAGLSAAPHRATG